MSTTSVCQSSVESVAGPVGDRPVFGARHAIPSPSQLREGVGWEGRREPETRDADVTSLYTPQLLAIFEFRLLIAAALPYKMELGYQNFMFLEKKRPSFLYSSNM